MNQKIYHGLITPTDIAASLISHFNRGNFRVQQTGNLDQITLQIATSSFHTSGGQTSISITLQVIEDGVSVTIGKQAWLGVAASLGETVFTAIRNPMQLISRLDDIAQDIESLQISEEIWKVIEDTASSHNASHEISEKLRRLMCRFCGTANPVGEPGCIACGAPLGDIQPSTCQNCGFVMTDIFKVCPNCNASI
jgi:hypothetical protein